jgi:hypothetical protein
MGWGICFALDDSLRVYCADGCNWRARESDYANFPEWPSARYAVLDYFEGEAHRELDMIRDEFPGTASGLKEACTDHIGYAQTAYRRMDPEKKKRLHDKTLAEFESTLETLRKSVHEANEKYKYYSEIWKNYKKNPPIHKPAKTRLQELAALIEPLQLEYDVEYWATEVDGYNRSIQKYEKLVRKEKKFQCEA